MTDDGEPTDGETPGGEAAAGETAGGERSDGETVAADAAAQDAAAEGTAVRRDRFSGGPAREFLSGLAADRRIFAADLAVDRAHVVMLSERGIVEAETADGILAALDEIAAAGYDALPDGEDVHEAIETAVIDRVGPAGGRMHTARSRNDEVATCLRYRFREDLLEAAAATVELREVLQGVAAGERETIAPGYTHLQPAQPTTVAHWALSYERAVARDTERLLDAYDRTNRSPLGAAAFAGTPFDVDRERTAGLLGFDGIVENATDAVSSRDFLLEGAGALATHAVTLSGLAEDLVVYSNRGFVELADAYASTSSIMPQKKNPDTMELVRARAGDAVGALSGLQTALKGLPRAYNRDLQRVTPHAWRAVDGVVPATEVAAGAVATATFDADALADAADEGFATATGVADALAMAGVPFRSAHEAVALAAEAADGETPSVDALDAAVESVLGEPATGLVDAATLESALDPVESVAARDSVGGPAPDAVDDALGRAADALSGDREALERRREGLAAASDRLDREVSGVDRTP